MDRRSPGMRRLAPIVALALLAGACGGQTPTAAPPSGSSTGAASPSAGRSPTPTGSTSATATELVVGLSAETESLDPYLVYQNAGNSIMYAIFDTLLTVGPGGSLGPGLASAWTVVDDRTIDLTLTDGIRFHDGEPMNADAVRFSIDRMLDLDPATDGPIADPSKLLNSGIKGDYLAIQKVDVVDALHVRIHLSRPDAALPSALGRLFILPPAYIGRVGNAEFGRKPVGTGPFTFVESVKDDHTTVARNPDYWASPRGAPMVATVRFRPLADPATRVNELTTGGVDILQDPSIDQRKTIDAAGAALAFSEDDPHHIEIWLTQDKRGKVATDPNASPSVKQAIEALAKPEVRTALNLAVDRQTILDTLFDGLGEPMTNLFVKGDLGYDPTIEPYRYDPDQARQMLADAGYPNGFEVQLDYCTCDRLDPIEAVVADLARIGVKVTITQFEISQFNNGWGQNTDPMRSSRLGFADPNTLLQLWIKTPPPPGKGFSLGRYSNPAVDRLIDQQAVTYDRDQRIAILQQIGKLSHDDPPAIFLFHSPNLYATSARVKGWKPHFIGYVPVVGVSVGG